MCGDSGVDFRWIIAGNKDDRTDRLFTDFSDHSQILAWRDLVAAISSRYLQRYGSSYVHSWRWESWNEPDGQCGRNLTVGIACNQQSFLAYLLRRLHMSSNPSVYHSVGSVHYMCIPRSRYYDATAAGLMATDPELT